jgi:hypothetical protein
MGKETLRGIRAEAEFQRRVDKVLAFLFRKGEEHGSDDSDGSD